MSGILTVVIAFMIFLVVALDVPFRGHFAIEPKPIEQFVL
jgi:hypothetical protein